MHMEMTPYREDDTVEEEHEEGLAAEISGRRVHHDMTQANLHCRK